MANTDGSFPGRATHRMTLDSEEDERIEQEEQKVLQERRKKKEQKRRKRQQNQRLAEEQALDDIIELQPGDLEVNLFQQDSNSRVEFERAVRKIRKFYPQFRQPKSKHDKKHRRRQVTPEESEQQDEEDSRPRKSDKTKKIEKKAEKKAQRKVQKKVERKPVQSEPKVKVKREQQSTKKDKLIQDVAVRWWYAIPQWPPQDFDYDSQLKKLGYRSLTPAIFPFEQQFKDGLQKVMPVIGFKGVYKSKYKLIDIRNKDEAPSQDFFNSKSVDELVKLLQLALNEQIHQLKNVEHHQSGQKQLLDQLLKRLQSVKSDF